jgi:hypothetical protein
VAVRERRGGRARRLRAGQSSSPVLACIIGALRPWMAPMISSDEIPSRYVPVVESATSARAKLWMIECDGSARRERARGGIVRRRPVAFVIYVDRPCGDVVDLDPALAIVARIGRAPASTFGPVTFVGFG